MNARNLATVAAAAVITNVMNGAVQAKTDDLLAAVRASAGDMAKVDKKAGTAAIDAGKALAAAGGDTDANKREFHVGYIMAALGLRSVDKACDVLDAAGHGRKLSKKQTRARTEAEETAYASSRKAHGRALIAGGLKQPREKAGAQTEPKGDDEPKGDGVTVTSPTGADEEMTGARVNDIIRQQSVMLLQLINKHAAKGGIDPIYASAVHIFHDRIANAADELEAQYK